jgi:hypothetical protein
MQSLQGASRRPECPPSAIPGTILICAMVTSVTDATPDDADQTRWGTRLPLGSQFPVTPVLARPARGAFPRQIGGHMDC